MNATATGMRHVLRCDIYRYFPAIDHAILKAEFRRRIACEKTLSLMDLIVDGSNPQEPVDLHFPGDDLFSPFERRRGLPIGNLTSQFFANLYLDRFRSFRDRSSARTLSALRRRFCVIPRRSGRHRPLAATHRGLFARTTAASASAQDPRARDISAIRFLRLRIAGEWRSSSP